jgi:hypothetical protein
VRPRPHLGLEHDPRRIVTATLLRIWCLLGLGEHTLTWHVFARPLRSYVFVLAVLGVALTIAAVLALPWVARLQIAGVFAMSVAATAWAFDFNMRGAAESSAHGRYFLIPAVLVLVAVFAAANTAAWRRRVVRLGVVAPALVLFSFVLGPHPMALVFNGFELAAVLLAAIVANQVTQEGESTWYEGIQLLALYVVLAIAFGFA